MQHHGSVHERSVSETPLRVLGIVAAGLLMVAATGSAQSADKHRPGQAHHPTAVAPLTAHSNAKGPVGATPARKVTAVPGQPNHNSVAPGQKSSLNPQPIPPGHGTSTGPKSKSSVAGTSAKRTTSKSRVKR